MSKCLITKVQVFNNVCLGKPIIGEHRGSTVLPLGSTYRRIGDHIRAPAGSDKLDFLTLLNCHIASGGSLKEAACRRRFEAKKRVPRRALLSWNYATSLPSLSLKPPATPPTACLGMGRSRSTGGGEKDGDEETPPAQSGWYERDKVQERHVMSTGGLLIVGWPLSTVSKLSCARGDQLIAAVLGVSRGPP